jgi:uncharacterized protein involved in exopolysaccharide biosynthesis/Mrp family chromosome partitioning ATPase
MFKFHFKRALIFGILGLTVGGIIAFTSASIYEATGEMLLGESAVSTVNSTLAPDVQRILEVGQARDPQTELQLLRSQSVFLQALQNVANRENQRSLVDEWVKLYLMYDVLTPDTRVNQIDQGSVATIRVRAQSGALAEKITDEVMAVYNEQRLANGRAGLQNAIRYLASQESATQKALTTAEDKYKAFTTSRGIASIDATAQFLTNQEAAAFATLSLTRGEAAGAEAEVTALAAGLGNIPKENPTTTISGLAPQANVMASQIGETERRYNELVSRYYEDHPKVVEVKRALDAMKKQAGTSNDLINVQSNKQLNPVYQGIQQQLEVARAKSQSFQQKLQEAEENYRQSQDRLKAVPADEAQIRQLKRELDVADLNFKRVKAQIDELRSRQETGIRVTPILVPGRAYLQPVAPDKPKFLFIGLIAGVCLGLIYSFMMEAMKLRVHTSHQLAELTGLPVVATIPAMGRGQQKGLSTFAQAGARPNESFRNYVSAFLAKNHEMPRMIMFTGIGMVAGRSSSSVQFALAMAGAGKRVIIVDADPIRGLVTRAFGAEGRSGLSELMDRNTLPTDTSEVLFSTQHENLWLLPTGSDATKTIADRRVDQVQAVMAFLRGQADIIVFDVPPCDMFSDASRMAEHTDEVCMVVSASTTNFSAIPNGYEILHRAGSDQVSLILTDASVGDEPFAGTANYSRAK